MTMHLYCYVLGRVEISVLFRAHPPFCFEISRTMYPTLTKEREKENVLSTKSILRGDKNNISSKSCEEWELKRITSQNICIVNKIQKALKVIACLCEFRMVYYFLFLLFIMETLLLKKILNFELNLKCNLAFWKNLNELSSLSSFRKFCFSPGKF